MERLKDTYIRANSYREKLWIVTMRKLVISSHQNSGIFHKYHKYPIANIFPEHQVFSQEKQKIRNGNKC